MIIKNTDSEDKIRKELGFRIKQYRISLNMNQTELGNKSNTSLSTVVRVEKGDDSKFSNYIKIFSALNLAENLNMVVPEPLPDYKDLYEAEHSTKKADKTVKMRKKVTPTAKDKKTKWVWKEDKEKQQ